MGRNPLKEFKYSLISDMHLNHPQLKTPYEVLKENIIVAGDCDNGLGGLKFLQKLKNKGHRVFACDGNHEHYSNTAQNRTIEETTARFREEYPQRTDIDDTLTILITNGWYVVENAFAWYHYMNDARYCVGDDPAVAQHSVNLQAALDAEFIRNSLQAEPNRRFIVVTHTAPCTETLDPRFEGALSNEWYWNPKMRPILTEFNDRILVWHHGHTHAKNEAIIDGVKVLCNPRGYPRENPDWAPAQLKIQY